MPDYSSQKAHVTYEWRGLNINTSVSVPHGRDGAEAISFLTRLVDGLSASYNKAQEDSHAAR